MKTVIALVALSLVSWALFVAAAVRDAAVIEASERVDSTECVAEVIAKGADYTIAVSSCAFPSGKTVEQVERDLP